MASKLGFEPEPHWWGGCKGFWWCGFAPFLVRFGGMFILSCGIAVLQNQAVCSIQKFSGNFNAVCGFPNCHCVRCLYLFLCGFAVFIHPLRPPHWWRRVLSPWQNLWYAKGKNSPQVNPVYFTTERSNDGFCLKCCLRHHWVFYQSMLTCMPHNIGQLSGWEFNVHFYPFPTLGIT